MFEDDLGLRYEVDLPDTQVGHDTAESVRRGDMDGSSFGFDCPPGGDEWDHSSSPPTRTLRMVSKIHDLGPVTFPAYTQTSAAMRSLDRSLADQNPAAVSVVVPEPTTDPCF
jgi:HK97 family phage prohead protease